jgi:2-iminobutanoate/2-iminopropanoate deaminase
MARDIIRTPNAPSPPATYSQAVRAAGLVFVSGTGPHDPVTGKIVGDTIQEQTRQCLENVSAILKAAGTSLERVVSATVILLEETDFAGMNEEWINGDLLPTTLSASGNMGRGCDARGNPSVDKESH